MRKIVVLALLVAAGTAGCAHSLGYAGAHPGYVRCKGKGSITGTGSAYLGAGIGGTGQNQFSLILDCGEGLELDQGPSIQPVPTK